MSTGVHQFCGLPVKDAETPLYIPLLQVDIDTAEELRSNGVNDPERFTDCVIAQACERTFGTHGRVSIKRTVATVAWENTKFAHRFKLSDGAREIVAAFDRGDHVEPGTLIALEPPEESRTLEYHRRTNAAYRAKHPEANVTPSKRKPKTARKQRKSDPISVEIRNGIFARAK